MTSQTLEKLVNSLKSNSCINSCVFGIIASSTNRLSILFAREQVLLNSFKSNSCINSCEFGIIASSTNRLSILFASEQVLLNFRFKRL